MARKVVLVKFSNNNGRVSTDPNSFTSDGYAYYVPEGIKLDNNDLVVVAVNNALAFAMVDQIEGLSESNLSKASKYIVCKVDTELYDKETKKMHKIKEIENALDARLKQYQRYDMFKRIAAEDVEMKKLLDELSALDPDTKLIEGVK